jgi:ApaG protein
MQKITKANKITADKIFNLSSDVKLEKPYSIITQDVDITVWPEFIDSKLNPIENLFIWAYHVRIQNKSNETIKLLSRYWRIVDANGIIQEVSGEGVIGEQPKILPQASYQYSSGVHLQSPSGIMMGHYQMQKDDGTIFNAKIPHFSLDVPSSKGVVN